MDRGQEGGQKVNLILSTAFFTVEDNFDRTQTLRLYSSDCLVIGEHRLNRRDANRMISSLLLLNVPRERLFGRHHDLRQNPARPDAGGRR